MVSISGMQLAEEWRGRLPARLEIAAGLLKSARSRSEEWHPEILEVLGVIEDGIKTIAADALGARWQRSPLDWLDWAVRVFGLLEGMVSFCVRLRCSGTTTVEGDLEVVAFELEQLAVEAKNVSRTLFRATVRGAA
jgi:hypothetical protein